MAKKQPTIVVDMTRQLELVAALKVLVLTPATAAYLQAHDPKALAQACEALGMTLADIAAITAPAPTADFTVVNHGSTFRFQVETDAARAHTQSSAFGLEAWQWLGPRAFAVDHRLAPELCYRLREDGFTVVVR